jgi:hypothetical protein
MNAFRLVEMGIVFECNEISGNSEGLEGGRQHSRKVLPINSKVSAYL